MNVQNCRFEDEEKERGQTFVVAALLIVFDEAPENPVFPAIAARLVTEEGKQSVPIGKWGKIGALGLQPLVELSEWFGIQLLPDAVKRKAHARNAAWASRNSKSTG